MAIDVRMCVCLMISGLTGWVVATPKDEHESCLVWDRIARQLSTTPGTQQTCWSNGTNPCTRIDCSGAYDYNTQNMLSLGIDRDIEVDYCFGIILNHCAPNISLDFYMQVPAKKVNKTTRVFHSSLRTVPGLSYPVSEGTVAQGYLYFEMARHNDTVKFSVTVKVRLTIHGYETWPSSLQRELVSDETVPVPPCDLNTATGPRKPSIGECHPPTWKKPTDDLGKPCHETSWCTRNKRLACDSRTNLCVCKPDYLQTKDSRGNAVCQPIARKCLVQADCRSLPNGHCVNRLCQCKDGYTYDDITKSCLSASTGSSTTVPTTSSTESSGKGTLPHKGAGSKNGQNKVAVILGAVFGGIVVLAGILVAAYFAIRRLRRPYHNRQLLLEGEDGDGIM